MGCCSCLNRRSTFESANLFEADSRYHESVLGKVFSTRYKLAFMGFLGFFLLYSMRVNISVALVDMVKDRDTENSTINENCPDHSHNSSSNSDEGTFDWTSGQEANVLSAFYYGYLVTQIPAGYVASRYGGKHMYGLGVLLTGIFTLLTPPVSYLGVEWLICLRVLEGVTESVTFPSFHHLTGRWTPKYERSLFSALAVSGASFGNMVTQPLIGYLCTLELWNGWPIGFLVNGLTAIVWYILWCLIVYDSPDQHPRISESEKNYIKLKSEVVNSQKLKIPWKGIFTSFRFFGLVAANFSCNFINYGMMSCLPLYLADVLNFEIAANGFLSALPWLCCFIGAILTSQITDWMRNKKYVSTTFIRKFNQFLSSFFPGLFLILAGYSECDSTLAVSFIAIGMFFFGAHYSACYCNNLDIAPQFAGVVFGISNTVATTSGIISPIIVDQITKDNIHSKQLWLYAFYTFAGISWAGGLAFLLFGSGEVQNWAVVEPTDGQRNGNDTDDE